MLFDLPQRSQKTDYKRRRSMGGVEGRIEEQPSWEEDERREETGWRRPRAHLNAQDGTAKIPSGRVIRGTAEVSGGSHSSYMALPLS